MKRIALAFCQAAAILLPEQVFAERHVGSFTDLASTAPQYHSSLRRRELKVHEDTHREHKDRQLQDVLRYVPMELGLSLETSQSGDIDTDELNTIVGVQILFYLQQTMVEYEAVSVETETITLSEPVRRLEETQPMILQVRVSGFVYFVGDSLPTSEYLDTMIESAFEGDEALHVLAKLEAAEDPALRSITAVWSGLADSKEEYLAIENSRSSIGDIIMDNITYISAGLACGVALIALFAGIQYRRSKNEDRDDLSLTEIPWLSVQVPKKAPKRGGSDGESTMEAPIEAIAGETTSVMIAVAGRTTEKIALKDDISVISKLAVPAGDKAALLTRLYENSLCNPGGIFEQKSVSFDDDMSYVIGCSFDEPKVTKCDAPKVTTPRPTTPETVRDQGQEIDINHVLSEEKSRRSMFSSKLKKRKEKKEKKKNVLTKKKVSMPSLRKTKSKSKTAEKIEYLDAIEEGEENSEAKESDSIPIAYLANEEEEIPTRYEMADDKGDILAAIANTNSGIMEAWDQISRKYSLDPNWDTNSSASSRDFENRSFQCLGPACVSTMSESHANNEDDMDDASDESTDCSDEYMTQYTESEHISQFTNPSTNASLSTGSYSCESASTISDDEGYSR